MAARTDSSVALSQTGRVLVAIGLMLVLFSDGARAQDPAPPEPEAVVKARAAFERATNFAADGKMREALGPAEEAVGLFEKAFGPDHEELIAPLVVASNMRRDVGDLRGAEAPLLRALAIAEQRLGEDNKLTCTVLNNVGVLYRMLGMYGKARPFYERALEARKRVLGPGAEDTGQSHTNLGILLREIGEYENASTHLRRGADIAERWYGFNHPTTGVSIGTLAMLANSQGNYSEADRLYRRALEIHEKTLGPEHRTTLITLNNLANFLVSTGAYDEATPLLERLLDTRMRIFGPEHPETLAAIANFGSLFMVRGDAARARPLYERALEIGKKLYESDSEKLARAYLAMANLELIEGRLDAAESSVRKALEVREKQLGLDNPNAAACLATLGSIYLARKDFASARSYLERAVAIDERTLGPEHPTSVSALRAWGELLWATGRTADAVEVQRRANDARERELIRNLTTGSEQRKLSYLELTADELDRTISLHQFAASSNALAARAALEIVVRRKGRALDAMTGQLESLRRRSSPEDRALLGELATVRAEYARHALSAVNTSDETTFRSELDRLQRRVDELEAVAAACSAEFRASTLPVTLDAVREGLPSDAVLVEFATYRPYDPNRRTFAPHRYTAYVLDNSGTVKWADLGPAAEIDVLVAALRSQLRTTAGERGLRTTARSLDEKVMRPVRRLVGKDRKRLLLSPDGALNLVPFAALVDERGRYLVETLEVVYLTSGRELLRLRPGGPGLRGGSAEIVANPDFGLSAIGDGPRFEFRPLPETETEARELGRLFPAATVLTGAQATESALKRMSGPSILHIATHGFYLDSDEESASTAATRRQWEATRDVVQIAAAAPPAPGSIVAATRAPLLRSGLGLAGANRKAVEGQDDGLLTALEVAGLDLWGTELVVLSACDTGVGQVSSGNGVYGLRRALTLAGAEAHVSSLWAVSDLSTRELMVAFYGELLAGSGRSEALRTTQLSMLRDPRRRHPFYWAGFVPSGAWWPISASGRPAAVPDR